MACPIHLWVPLMAAAAPVARVAKHRVSLWRAARQTPEEQAPRQIKRWAPVGAPVSDGPGDTSSSTSS